MVASTPSMSRSMAWVIGENPLVPIFARLSPMCMPMFSASLNG